MKRIVVLGAGESGAGAAVLAKAKGFDVFVSDMSAIKDKYKTLFNVTKNFMLVFRDTFQVLQVLYHGP